MTHTEQLRAAADRRIASLSADVAEERAKEATTIAEARRDKLPINFDYWSDRYRIEEKLRVARALRAALEGT